VKSRPDDPPLEGEEVEVLEEGDVKDSGAILEGDPVENLPQG